MHLHSTHLLPVVHRGLSLVVAFYILLRVSHAIVGTSLILYLSSVLVACSCLPMLSSITTSVHTCMALFRLSSSLATPCWPVTSSFSCLARRLSLHHCGLYAIFIEIWRWTDSLPSAELLVSKVCPFTVISSLGLTQYFSSKFLLGIIRWFLPIPLYGSWSVHHLLRYTTKYSFLLWQPRVPVKPKCYLVVSMATQWLCGRRVSWKASQDRPGNHHHISCH